MKDSLRRLKAEIFHALAHPTRIAIVEALRNGETAAGNLIDQLQLEQANASQHLSVLPGRKLCCMEFCWPSDGLRRRRLRLDRSV